MAQNNVNFSSFPKEPEENLAKQKTHWLIGAASLDDDESRALHYIHLHAYEYAKQFVHDRILLDWGCNDGYGLAALAPYAAKAIGLDVSEEAVAAAKSNLLELSIDLVHYDGIRSPFHDDSVDVVTSFQVIEHVAQYDAYLGDISRVLQPDGIALFTTPNAVIRLDPGMSPWNSFHIHEFNAADLEATLYKWFDEVQVLGLFATSEIDSLERKRVQRMKRLAMKPQWWRMRAALINGVKACLPSKVTDALRHRLRKCGKTSSEARAHDSKSTIQERDSSSAPTTLEQADFSKARLWYSQTNVNHALDLLAICRKPKKLRYSFLRNDVNK